MSKASVDGAKIRELLMQDEEYRKEYNRLKPRYNLIAKILESRDNQNIRREEISGRVDIEFPIKQQQIENAVFV